MHVLILQAKYIHIKKILIDLYLSVYGAKNILLLNFKNDYSERRHRLNLTSLKERRIRRDLIEIRPLLNKNNDLTGSASGVRGNALRLGRESFKSRIRNDFS